MVRSESKACAPAANISPWWPNPVQRYSAFAVQLRVSGISTPAPAAQPMRQGCDVSTVPGVANPTAGNASNLDARHLIKAPGQTAGAIEQEMVEGITEACAQGAGINLGLAIAHLAGEAES